MIIKRVYATTAPGPDGLTNKIWKKIPSEMIHLLAQVFTECLKRGEFPNAWKRAILVLIPKGIETTDGPKARPICLIDEVGKSFERILVERINTWIETRQKDGFYTLSNNQFGFRKNKSTVDALIKVRKYIESQTGKGNVVIAISLDIKNAFNSIPWKCIRKALYWKGCSRHLKRIIHSYLSDRHIEYINKSGRIQYLSVEAGVPQGSVIGPLLWNIAYDTVLYVDKEPGCEIYCYADDTVILVAGDTFREACDKASIQTERTIDKIKDLQLQVAIDKTEEVAFYKKWGRPPNKASIQIGNVEIPVKSSFKYLGIVFDSRLIFRKHFQYVDQKISKVNRALFRLLPNLRGPHESKRRLYAHILQSIVMYEAPLWSDKLMRSAESLRLLAKNQRAVAIKVIAGYRTISYDAAVALARIPPWPLVAQKVQQYIYIQKYRK